MYHNYQTFFNYPGSPHMAAFGTLAVLFPILFIWDLAWKGYGLWKAAKNNETGWFVAILILNTIGILPILYIYLFAKDRKAKTTK